MAQSQDIDTGGSPADTSGNNFAALPPSAQAPALSRGFERGWTPPTIRCAVWKAAAFGDFEKLRELAEAEPEALHRPDDQGFYALQWAALNNRVAVLTYLLDKGCDIHAADSTGQNALHWSAVRGSVGAMETLLRAGADLSAQDSRCACGWPACLCVGEMCQRGSYTPI
jgi:palmitoyltransferase